MTKEYVPNKGTGQNFKKITKKNVDKQFPVKNSK